MPVPDPIVVPAKMVDGKVACGCDDLPDVVTPGDPEQICYLCWKQAREDELDAGIVCGPSTEACDRRKESAAFRDGRR